MKYWTETSNKTVVDKMIPISQNREKHRYCVVSAAVENQVISHLENLDDGRGVLQI